MLDGCGFFGLLVVGVVFYFLCCFFGGSLLLYLAVLGWLCFGLLLLW